MNTPQALLYGYLLGAVVTLVIVIVSDIKKP